MDLTNDDVWAGVNWIPFSFWTEAIALLRSLRVIVGLGIDSSCLMIWSWIGSAATVSWMSWLWFISSLITDRSKVGLSLKTSFTIESTSNSVWFSSLKVWRAYLNSFFRMVPLLVELRVSIIWATTALVYGRLSWVIAFILSVFAIIASLSWTLSITPVFSAPAD